LQVLLASFACKFGRQVWPASFAGKLCLKVLLASFAASFAESFAIKFCLQVLLASFACKFCLFKNQKAFLRGWSLLNVVLLVFTQIKFQPIRQKTCQLYKP